MSDRRQARDSPATPTQGEPLITDPTHLTDASPIDGATLLDQARDAIRTYVILPTEHDLNAVTLWIAATHGQPAFSAAPRLVIRAPEKRCGKSRLLDLVEALCHDPLITVNASPPAIYRSIGVGDPPTLLIDEADTIFGPKAKDGNEEIRGLLNAGYQRNRAALRYNAAEKHVEKIPTFAMAALAGIGVMPDTIEDRAIVIRMRRRAPGEKVKPYRQKRDAPPLTALRTRLREWIRTNGRTLEAATPLMPLEDRAADTWEPLFAVADLAGSEWPDRVREAALVLTAAKEASDEQPVTVRLLIDCRAAFAALPALPSEELLTRLKEDPEAPWAGWGGRPDGLTAMKLGQMLKDFDIRSAMIRFPPEDYPDVGQARGYRRTDFLDAWDRYCPPPDLTQSDTEPGPDAPVMDLDRTTAGRKLYQAVPAVTHQVSPGTACNPGTAQAVPHRPWYGSSRTTDQAVPALTCTGTPGTAGTAHPPKPAVCIICREPLTHDDGTHTHPLCVPA